MNKNTFIILAVLIFTACLTSLFAQFDGGSGTETDPWQVSNAQQLNNVRNYLGNSNTDKYFIQTADISLDIAPYNQGEGWQPIGTYISFDDFSSSFYGNYNGSNHVVYNMYINRPNSECQGLFGVVCGTITNLGVTNANVTGTSSGILSGLIAYATISNVYSSGNSTGTDHHAGGLFGMGGFSNVSCSFSNASVTSTFNTGGFIGDCTDIQFMNCYSTGNVNGNDEDCSGGFTGWASSSVFTNCYSTGHVIGGINGDIGGFVGYNDESTFTACYWNTQTSGQSSSPGADGRTTDDMTYPYAVNTYQGWDFTEIWESDITGVYNNGYPFLQSSGSVTNDDNTTPIEPFSLVNYPNPFNSSTNLRFYMNKAVLTSVKIFNVKGQLINTLNLNFRSTGFQEISWNGKDRAGNDCTSGLYYSILQSGNNKQIRKMLLFR